MNQGRAEGRAEAVRVLIKTARKYCVSDEEILKDLVTEMSMTEAEAREYLKNIPT